MKYPSLDTLLNELREVFSPKDKEGLQALEKFRDVLIRAVEEDVPKFSGMVSEIKKELASEGELETDSRKDDSGALVIRKKS